MFRLLIAALTAAASAGPLFAAEAPPATPAVSQVFYASNASAFLRAADDPGRIRAMVQALVLAVTGQNDWARAWRTLVTPSDRVGIKVSTVGGRGFSTHPLVVSAIVSGLEAAGVPRDRIIVWDREMDNLREAGFLPRNGRYEVRAIDPPRGFDREAEIIGNVSSKLMWGDLLFVEKPRFAPGKAREEGTQLSSNSFLARIVSRDVTKIINVPVLSDERGCGVAGAIYNMTIPNIDNWRRFTQTVGPISASPAEIYADERIAPKCVLHIMDALLAQYAGGPGFAPQYSIRHETLYASRDPVALDSVVLRKIDEWRVAVKLPPLAKQGAWLNDAAAMELGNAAPERVSLEPVAIPR